MTSMRRIVFIVAALVVMVPPRPAAAHSCASPVAVEPGVSSTITIGVAAEAQSVVEVEVRVPDGFRLEEVPATEGWQSSERDDSVRFTGGAIPPFGCGYFSLTGAAEGRGTLAFPLTVTDDTGGTRDYTSTELGDPYAAQLVYAGSQPEGEQGRGSPAWQVALVAVFAVALLAGAVTVARSALRTTTGPAPRRPSRRPAARGRGRPGIGSSRSGSRTRRPPRHR